jgi:ABC-type multidrug transport system fused ATPase/permease subunit
MSMKMTDWNRPMARHPYQKGKGKDTDNEYIKKYPDKEIFKRLLKFLFPYRKHVIGLIVLLLITSVTQLVYPVGMTIILHIIYPQEKTTALSLFIENMLIFVADDAYTRLIIVGFILFAVLVLNFIVKRTYNYNLQKLSQYLIADIRADMFLHLQQLPMAYYSDTPAGKIVSRLTNDVATVQTLISTEIIQGIGDIFMIFSSIFLMFTMSWRLSLIIILLAPIFGFIFFMFSKRSRVYWIRERRTIAELTGILQESISGSKTIKAFVVEDENIEEFSNVNQQNMFYSLQAARIKAVLQPITQIIIAVAISVVVYVGSLFVRTGTLEVSILLGYVILAQQFMNPLNNLGNLYNNAQQALAAGDRILTTLDTPVTLKDIPNAPELPPVKGEISYDHVYFHYVPNIPVLDDIHIDFKPNERVALVGFTGAGKSTFISLLSRFYDPTQGRILIDGYDISKVTMKSLRSQMGIVLQDNFLFNGTVMDNIRFGRLNATDEDVIAAAKQVGAHPFIMRLPENYRTNVQERGSLLSIGQRQLIAFARALLADPRILILDEATSSVDPYTELKIQEALETLLKGRNSFIIAHRLSTILNSDRILVMDNGKIIQQGTHESLIHQGGLYKHLYEMQFQEQAKKVASNENKT